MITHEYKENNPIFSYPVLLKAVADFYTKNGNQYLIMAIFQQLIGRDDFNSLQIVNNEDQINDVSKNWLVLQQGVTPDTVLWKIMRG